MEKLAQMKDFSFAYAGQAKNALHGVSFSIAPGEFVLLCGRSGCGKSTLLRCLKPELRPAGKMTGECFAAQEENAMAVGFVAQDPETQIVTDSVQREMAFGLENMGLPQEQIRRRTAETAAFLGITPWFGQKTASLSGGQKQIVNLGAVLAMRPSLLLLDEPTAQLDPIAAQSFLSLLERVRTELGIAVLLCEHRIDSLLDRADRVIYMEEGGIAFDGTPVGFASLIGADPDHPYALAMPAAVRISRGEAGVLSVSQGRNWIGKRAGCYSVEPKTRNRLTEDTALSARELYFRYEKKEAAVLNAASLTLKRGSIHAVLGGNGSGKSTLLQVLCGVRRAESGRIKKDKAPRMVLLMQQIKALFTKETLREELSQGDAAKREELLRQFGLDGLLDRHPFDLSGGEMQKAALIKVLLLEPDILLLDEPTKGMDAFSVYSVSSVLKTFADKGGSVLAVTHDPSFAAQTADTCSLMFAGEIICTRPVRDFFTDNLFYTTPAAVMTRGCERLALAPEEIKWSGD